MFQNALEVSEALQKVTGGFKEVQGCSIRFQIDSGAFQAVFRGFKSAQKVSKESLKVL